MSDNTVFNHRTSVATNLHLKVVFAFIFYSLSLETLFFSVSFRLV